MTSSKITKTKEPKDHLTIKEAQHELTKVKMYHIFVFSDRFLHRGVPLRTVTLLTETDLVKLDHRNLGRGGLQQKYRHRFKGGT